MVAEYISLANGVKIPAVGFGTFRIEDGEEVIESVKTAIKSGYRHIDTAACYENEEGVGEAIKASGVKRQELFITTKLWNSEQGYDTTLRAFDESMAKLGLDYLDLYLIHWPCTKNKNYQELNYQTWRAFEKLYGEGRIKSIGVSNFLIHHLQPLMDKAKVMPMVNQLELNPQHQQPKIVEFCKKNKIVCEAWGPLMQGRDLDNKVLVDIAKTHGKTAGQVLIRWSLQKGFVPLPKSTNAARISSNYKVFDFELSVADMGKLDSLEGKGFSGLDPDKAQW